MAHASGRRPGLARPPGHARRRAFGVCRPRLAVARGAVQARLHAQRIRAAHAGVPARRPRRPAPTLSPPRPRPRRHRLDGGRNPARLRLSARRARPRPRPARRADLSGRGAAGGRDVIAGGADGARRGAGSRRAHGRRDRNAGDGGRLRGAVSRHCNRSVATFPRPAPVRDAGGRGRHRGAAPPRRGAGLGRAADGAHRRAERHCALRLRGGRHGWRGRADGGPPDARPRTAGARVRDLARPRRNHRAGVLARRARGRADPRAMRRLAQSRRDDRGDRRPRAGGHLALHRDGAVSGLPAAARAQGGAGGGQKERYALTATDWPTVELASICAWRWIICSTKLLSEEAEPAPELLFWAELELLAPGIVIDTCEPFAYEMVVVLEPSALVTVWFVSPCVLELLHEPLPALPDALAPPAPPIRLATSKPPPPPWWWWCPCIPWVWPWACVWSCPSSALVRSCGVIEPLPLLICAKRLVACVVLPFCPKAVSNSDWLIWPSPLVSSIEKSCWLSASPLTMSSGCCPCPCPCSENSALIVAGDSGADGALEDVVVVDGVAEVPGVAAGSKVVGDCAALLPERACCSDETRSSAFAAAAPARRNMDSTPQESETPWQADCKGRADPALAVSH